MNFSVVKKELIDALFPLNRIVVNKSTDVLLQGICFSTDADKLNLSATNMEISIHTVLPADVKEDGSIVLSGVFMINIIKKLSGDTVFFESIGNDQIKVKSETSEYVLKGFSDERFPEFPKVNEEFELKISPEILKELIQKSIFSIARNDSIPAITGAKFEVCGRENLKISALDGYRMSQSSTKKFEINKDIDKSPIIPGKTLQIIQSLLTGRTEDVKIKFSDTQILIEIGNILFASRLLEGEFVNIDNIIPKEFDTEVQVDRKTLLEGCERAAIVSEEGKNNMVVFDINMDLMKITSTSDIGNALEQIAVKSSGSSLTIAFNVKYLIDPLKTVDNEKLKIKFGSNISPAVIVPEDGEDFLFLVLPMRIRED